MDEIKVGLQTFRQSLKVLDEKLEGEKIEIRAIGGFALLFHKVRQTGSTRDIDSVTRDYSPRVQKLIKEVAEEASETLQVEEGWLNNDNVFDNDIESIEAMLEPFWEKVEWGFSNITLYVADIETLFRAKLLASEDDNLTGRTQDLPDLVDIFFKEGKRTLGDCVDYCTKLDISLEKDYPRVYSRLVRVLKGECLV